MSNFKDRILLINLDECFFDSYDVGTNTMLPKIYREAIEDLESTRIDKDTSFIYIIPEGITREEFIKKAQEIIDENTNEFNRYLKDTEELVNITETLQARYNALRQRFSKKFDKSYVPSCCTKIKKEIDSFIKERNKITDIMIKLHKKISIKDIVEDLGAVPIEEYVGDEAVCQVSYIDKGVSSEVVLT